MSHLKNPSLFRLPIYDGKDLALTALNGAAHHRGSIREVLDAAQRQWAASGDFDSPQGLVLDTKKLIWHTRSFFWELFAVSDMILHWSNTKYALGLEESQVRWEDLRKRKSPINRATWRKVRDVIADYRSQAIFFEIKTYP